METIHVDDSQRILSTNDPQLANLINVEIVEVRFLIKMTCNRARQKEKNVTIVGKREIFSKYWELA